jgi:hypothetical protein
VREYYSAVRLIAHALDLRALYGLSEFDLREHWEALKPDPNPNPNANPNPNPNPDPDPNPNPNPNPDPDPDPNPYPYPNPITRRRASSRLSDSATRSL